MPNIAAIATPAGSGGIAVIRISGPDTKSLLTKIFRPHSVKFRDFDPWRLHHGVIVDMDNESLDDGLVVYMPGPASFTGEDVGEIHCHGGSLLAEVILENLLKLGSRQAERGEFTKRAFLNGRMDLSQAEAVAELISAPSREAISYSLGRLEGKLSEQIELLQENINELRALAQALIDFPDDEVDIIQPEEFLNKTEKIKYAIEKLLVSSRRARTMQYGLTILLVGMVNAGKSSLLNSLTGQKRALVSEMPGTTRDYIEASLNLDGLPVHLIDSAGLRPESNDAGPVEKLGINVTRELLHKADMVVWVVDGASYEQDNASLLELYKAIGNKPLLMVWNKCDIKLPDQWPPAWAKDKTACIISAKTNENIDELARLIRHLAVDQETKAEGGVAPNLRQTQTLEIALQEISMLITDLNSSLTYDCCLSRLDTAAVALEKILYIEPSSELLDRIFSQFCIGK